AEYHAPIAPMMKGIDAPSMVKDSIGWGTMSAMASVLMAQRGFTGIEPLFSDSPNPDWMASLGEQYEILNVYFKPFACCRWAQPAIAGALQLAQQHRLAPCAIARVVVRTFSAAARLSRAHPQNTEQAQYNLAYPVAAALMDGELGPRQVLPPRIGNRTIRDLADRVEVVVAPEYDALFPRHAIADVQLVMRDGHVFTAERVHARWEPPAVPSDEELAQKFHGLVAPLLGANRAAQLADTIWEFERVQSAREFVQRCVKA
ncbi:MAG: MmgE/PrpD family protein, partial [Chloroflexi bacterium]|nr:MmgE/PrpD family protein [Chloroflexota bacterium]